MKMNSMKAFALVGVLSIGLLISGCDNLFDDNDGGGQANDGNLKFPTGSTTGTIYPLGSAMADLWNNELDDVKVDVQASNGGVDNLNLLKDGEGQISFVTTGILSEAYNGERSFEDRQYDDARILGGVYLNPNQLVVKKDAGIDSVADLKGKKFAPGSVGSTPEVESSIILPEYGIDYPDDIDENFVGFTEAIDLMQNNQLDGALIQAGLPTSAVSEMISTADAELIDIDGDVRESLKEQYPWYTDMTIPSGTYEGQDEDVETLAIKMVIMTDASVDDDVIYDLTKTLWENVDELESAHSIAKQMDIDEATNDLADIPIHEGAKRYYEEEGILD
ncbi:MAG TPA: TAXI family TRAP transporter solute-binding subunit [Virgibacillus sp.]|nr:TAXI family TRAP transporter solute-binding subunit [Virgibacillus sp.]